MKQGQPKEERAHMQTRDLMYSHFPQPPRTPGVVLALVTVVTLGTHVRDKEMGLVFELKLIQASSHGIDQGFQSMIFATAILAREKEHILLTCSAMLLPISQDGTMQRNRIIFTIFLDRAWFFFVLKYIMKYPASSGTSRRDTVVICQVILQAGPTVEPDDPILGQLIRPSSTLSTMTQWLGNPWKFPNFFMGTTHWEHRIMLEFDAPEFCGGYGTFRQVAG